MDWVDGPRIAVLGHMSDLVHLGFVAACIRRNDSDGGIRAYRPFDRWYLRRTTRWALRRCPVVIAVSESTRRDLVEVYGADPERVVVVHSAASPPPPKLQVRRARLAELGVAGPFALHVGRVEPRKNQAAALAAVERVDGLTLVSAGPIADVALADRLLASGRARVLGRVDAGDLELLYRTASALVFPSLYEGFGFPVLEAMLRGLPVVTVRSSSLPEVGDQGYAARVAVRLSPVFSNPLTI